MGKSFVAALVVTLGFAINAAAQGFSIYENSACAMGRGGAAVAAPCDDGSSIFFNPSGLAFFETTQLSVGGTLINPSGGFTNNNGTHTDLHSRYYPVPNAYYVGHRGNVAFGIGAFTPFGLTTDWPVTFEGRYLSYKASIRTVYIQPTVAYKVNENLAIGGGVDISHVYLELNQRVDLSSQILSPPLTFAAIGVPPGTDFADTRLSGDSWQAGFHLGVTAKLSTSVSLGARYLSRQKVNITNGTVSATQLATGLVTPVPLPGIGPAGTPLDLVLRGQFSGTGALAPQAAQTSLTLPDELVVGAAFTFGPGGRSLVTADYEFTHWALFDQLVIVRANSTVPTINVENYNNAHDVRLGIEHAANKIVRVRAGFIAHTAASPAETVTPLLPEAPRRNASLGVGLFEGRGLSLDLAYQHLWQSNRAGRTVPGNASNNNGVYSFSANLFSASLSVLF